MKNTFIILALALTALAYGCSKTNDSTTNISVPLGSFTGKFTRLHKKLSTGAMDTLTAIITVTTTNKSLFNVTGDTSKVHAGSHGSFLINANYMQFSDSTATTVNAPKMHLNGVYQYTYTGSALQFTAANDTLAVLYDLKKN